MGKKIFIAPIFGVELTNAVNNEFRIIRATLISKDKLRKLRKRFGVAEQISKLPRVQREYFFDVSKTFAIITHNEKLSADEIKKKSVEILKKELQLLTVSHLQFNRRGEVFSPQIMSDQLLTYDNYAINEISNGKLSGRLHIGALKGPILSLSLDKGWIAFQKENFFFRLLKLLRDEDLKVKLNIKWRSDLRRACELVGQSQNETDLEQAFLLNMIAFELLLTDSMEGKFVDILPKRVEALLGWLNEWKANDFVKQIEDIYGKRCSLVHRGKVDNLTVENLLFTDLLLFNIILNLVSFPAQFNSRKDLIEFSIKLEAEKILDIKRKAIGLKFRRISRDLADVKKFFNQ